MKLIKRLGIRVDKKGKKCSWGEFLCYFDNNIVERKLLDGLRQKSCGCAKGKLISEANKGRLVGENNPNYGKKGVGHPAFGYKHSKENKLIFSKINKGKIVSEETRQKQSKTRIEKEYSKGENNSMYDVHRYGKLNPNWNGGTSFGQYSIEFNKELKDYIKNRDMNMCQTPNCMNIDNLDCHHIDYDKQKNNPKNLITLCKSCHMKTNGKNKRKYFTEFYSEIVSDYL